MTFMSIIRRFAPVSAVVSAVMLSAAFATPSHALTIGPEVTAFDPNANPAFSCPKNKPCLTGLTILQNSGDDTVLAAAESIFGFDTGELTIWDKFDLGNSQSRDGDFSVQTNVSFTSPLPNRPNKVNKWSLNSSGPITFNPAEIVGFAAKFGNFTGFFAFRTEDLPLPADLEVLFYSLEFYDAFLGIGLAAQQNNGRFGGLSHVTIFGGPISTIPIPAALPLAATGLAVLGLLGWRKNRRAA